MGLIARVFFSWAALMCRAAGLPLRAGCNGACDQGRRRDRCDCGVQR